MAISLNGNSNVPQPSKLKEEAKQKLTDRVTIKGVVHRYWEAQKKQCTMTFSALTQGQYNTLASYFYNQASAVTYYNDVSGFTFTGFPTVAETEYIPGASYLKDLEVTLVEQ